MKIVSLKNFLALPAGTVYFNYIEHNFDLDGIPALMIKGETLDDSFYEATCVSTDTGLDALILLGKAAKNGKSFLLNPQAEKFDGTFRDEQLYAVYEPKDAKQLVTRLLQAFGDSGLLDKGMVSMVDQVINVTGHLHYEANVFPKADDRSMYETQRKADLTPKPSAADKTSAAYMAALNGLRGPEIIPTPGAREAALAANAETANRLCIQVIRPNKDGVNVNYGRLAVGHLKGVPLVGQVESLIAMNVPCVYVERIPKFVEGINLKVLWKDDAGGEHEATIYALEKEDLASLGEDLSKNDRAVMAVHRGYCLQTWVNGETDGERKTIDNFDRPSHTSPEEIEDSKF